MPGLFIIFCILFFTVAACIGFMRHEVLKLKEIFRYIPRYSYEPYETGLGHSRIQRLKTLPGFAVIMVTLHEDDLFFSHKGFNLPELKRSIRASLKKGKLKGGSSITQQLAKNVFRLKYPRWIRKCIEALYTVLIEYYFTKEEIFLLYLDNIRLHYDQRTGWEQAVHYYFHKPIGHLTIAETLFLANMIPSPSIRSTSIQDYHYIDSFPYFHSYGRLFDCIRFIAGTWGSLLLNDVYSISFKESVTALRHYASFRHDQFDESLQASFGVRVAIEMDELRKCLTNVAAMGTLPIPPLMP